jgi:iron complex transport system substrate-binding protein
MKCRVFWAFIIVVLVAGSLLGGCGNGPAQEHQQASPTAQVNESQAVTIVDALGRGVELPQPPERIVVAGKSSLTIVNTLFLFPQAKDRVVGLVVGNQNPGEFLKFIDPAFDQKAVLEVEAGPEQIAPLEPDVVVLRSFMAENLGEPLEQLGIPVVYVDLETPEHYFRDMRTLGKLLGNEARAEEIIAYYQEKLDQVNKNLAGLAQDEMPNVLLLQYSEKGGEVALNVPSASWMQTTEAELAGGEPVWQESAKSGGWTVVNLEQIAAWDPDKVFVIYYKADSSEIAEQLKADAQWQALDAAETGEIYGFAADTFSWDQPDPRWILGVTWLAGKIHPDRFRDLDIQLEVVQFFEEMYGMDKGAIEANILPNLKGNVE